MVKLLVVVEMPGAQTEEEARKNFDIFRKGTAINGPPPLSLQMVGEAGADRLVARRLLDYQSPPKMPGDGWELHLGTSGKLKVPGATIYRFKKGRDGDEQLVVVPDVPPTCVP